MIEILVTQRIGEREIPDREMSDAKKIFAKLKETPKLAVGISAKGVPENAVLYKVYATTAHGARRLLFFFHHPSSSRFHSTQPPDRWLLLFYRSKNDAVGKNMSAANPNFENQLARNLAMRDLE